MKEEAEFSNCLGSRLRFLRFVDLCKIYLISVSCFDDYLVIMVTHTVCWDTMLCANEHSQSSVKASINHHSAN